MSWADASQEGLQFEVADGIREVKLGAYRATGTEVITRALTGTAVVRNRTPGGVGGRREQSRLLPNRVVSLGDYCCSVKWWFLRKTEI